MNIKSKTSWNLLIFILLTFSFDLGVKSQENQFCIDDSPLLFYINHDNLNYGCKNFDETYHLSYPMIEAINPNCTFATNYIYRNTSDFSLEIFSVLDTSQTDILQLSSREDWLSSGLFWLDNDYLSLFITSNPDEFLGERIVINPWTQKEYLVSPDIPLAATHLNYDPTLTRLTFRDTTASDETLNLFHLQTGEATQVATIGSLTPPFSYNPYWSIDGSEFLYVKSTSTPATFELFRVQENGDQVQLTDLGTTQEIPSLFATFSWSPDKRYVAFWWMSSEVYMDIQSEFQFYIYDIENDELSDVSLFHRNEGVFDIAWAPDSSRIAIITDHENSDDDLVIYDIEQNHTQTIAQDVTDILNWCNTSNS